MKDYLDSLFGRKYIIPIAKEILFFIGNNNDSEHDKIKMLNNFIRLFKTNNNFRKEFKSVFDNQLSLTITDKQILAVLNILTDKRKRYEIHLKVKNEQVNKYVQDFFTKAIAV